MNLDVRRVEIRELVDQQLAFARQVRHHERRVEEATADLAGARAALAEVNTRVNVLIEEYSRVAEAEE